VTRVNVRYMVEDVEKSIAFYTTLLGFSLISNMAPACADVSRGDLRLLLSGATSSAGGAHFRNDVIKGPGGSQVLLEDPSGNVIELFKPRGG
jgi:predicted enzyme related to lactoylglutathione lyase